MNILTRVNIPPEEEQLPKRNGRTGKPKVSREEKPPAPLPTESLDAEQATLGALLMESGAAQLARAVLVPLDFHRELHKTIFAVCCEILDAGREADCFTVSEALRDKGQLDGVGGAPYLFSLIEACDSSARVEEYAARVKELSERRRAIETARSLEAIARSAPREQYLRALASVVEAEEKAVALARPRFTPRTLAELRERPRLPAFIEGIAPQGALIGLVGPYGSGKSFVALDWALCASTGHSWNGRKVAGGAVVYITPEGTQGFSDRAQAWCIARGEEGAPVELPANFHQIEDAPLLMYPGDVEELLRVIKRLPEVPAFVVIDTVARHMVGGDENSQKDMGLFIAGADRIRTATGSTVLLVHHAGKDGKMRGSTALPGAMDAVIETNKPTEGFLTLSCGKAKDMAPFEELGFVSRVVELPEMNPETGRPFTSLVFELDASGPKKPEMSASAGEFLEVLAGLGGCASYSEWEVENKKRGLKTGSFFRHFATLRDAGLIQKEGTKWRLKSPEGTPLPSPSNHLQTPSLKAPQEEQATFTFIPSPPSLEGEGVKVKVAPSGEGVKPGRKKRAVVDSEPYRNGT